MASLANSLYLYIIMGVASLRFLGTCGPIVIIVRQHRSTAYVLLRVDAAYCYKPSSVVCRTYRSVCQSVTVVSPAKMAQPIEMPFGWRTRVGPGNHVLDEGPHPPWKRAILREEEAANCKL